MAAANVGIKVADGTLFPVLEPDYVGQKRLVLTTVRDNQKTVQIDLFRGDSPRAEQSDYVGSLIIENIQNAPRGEPEIEVVLGVDPDGNLNANASDLFTGENQSLSVNLSSLSSESLYTIPDFELQKPGTEGEEEDTLLTGETYPIGTKDRRKEHLERRKHQPLALIGFVLLGLLVILGLAYLAFRLLSGPAIPPLIGGGKTAPSASALPAPAPAAAPPPAPASAAVAPAPPAPPPAAPSPPSKGITYRVKWGDTLWDLSATYYRNPWLYPKIARANNIPNPDLIFAGTSIVIPEP